MNVSVSRDSAHRTSSMLPPGAEVFMPFPLPRAKLPMARSFRTTWLASSLAALRERNLMDAYLTHLPKQYHETILGSVAGQWAPIEVAAQHYAACDKLELSRDELQQIGKTVTQRVHGSILNTVVKLAKQGGVTPWTAFAQLNRLWERIWEGGGVAVYKLGPKDAVVEIAAWPLSTNRYVRETMPSVVVAMIELFCRRAYGSVLYGMSTDESLAVSTSWV